jgi:hypothetical protein
MVIIKENNFLPNMLLQKNWLCIKFLKNVAIPNFFPYRVSFARDPKTVRRFSAVFHLRHLVKFQPIYRRTVVPLLPLHGPQITEECNKAGRFFAKKLSAYPCESVNSIYFWNIIHQSKAQIELDSMILFSFKLELHRRKYANMRKSSGDHINIFACYRVV